MLCGPPEQEFEQEFEHVGSLVECRETRRSLGPSSRVFLVRSSILTNDLTLVCLMSSFVAAREDLFGARLVRVTFVNEV